MYLYLHFPLFLGLICLVLRQCIAAWPHFSPSETPHVCHTRTTATFRQHTIPPRRPSGQFLAHRRQLSKPSARLHTFLSIFHPHTHDFRL
ncbi:hypothetical protein C8J57DRAFT_1371754 [Mycena rebaudengoi]|nr:hypothetical protein C8J57DRAFT_1371754 [Mycena rebaudengoi]